MHIPDEVRDAWGCLHEDDKKRLCQSLQKEQLLKIWINETGLSKGFRIQTIAKRQLTSHQLKQFDQSFFDVRGGEYAQKMLGMYFVDWNPEIHEECKELILSCNGTPAKRINDALKLLVQNHDNSSLVRLYVAFAGWIGSELFEDVFEREASKERDLVLGDIEVVERKFEALQKIVPELEKAFEKICSAQPCDSENCESVLQECIELGKDLRKRLKSLSDYFSLPYPTWNKLSDIYDVVEALKSNTAKVFDEKKEKVLIDLVETLESCQIIHRSNRKKDELNKLRLDACNEIKTVIGRKDESRLPGPIFQKAEDWLNWVLEARGERLDKLLTELHNFAPSLAELLAEIGPENLKLKSVDTDEPGIISAAGESKSILQDMEIQKPAESEAIEPEQFEEITKGGIEEKISDEKKEDKEILSGNADVPARIKITPMETEDIVKDKQVAPSYEAIRSSSDAAKAVLESSPIDRANLIDHLVWHLIHENEYAFAFQISRLLAKIKPDFSPRLEPWIVRPLILAKHVSWPSDEVSRLLKEDYSQLSETFYANLPEDWLYASTFLLIAGAVRPALLAPSTEAYGVLSQVHLESGLEELFKHIKYIAEQSIQHPNLNPDSLRRIRSEAVWERDLEKVISEAKAWFAQAQQIKMPFQPATRVWLDWQKKGGRIEALLRPICENDISNMDSLREQITRLSDPRNIRQEINITRQKISGRSKPTPIIAGALNKIQNHINEAVTLAARWIDLHANHPSQSSEYKYRHLEDLSSKIKDLTGPVTEEISRFVERNKAFIVTVAAIECRKALKQVFEMFCADDVSPKNGMLIRHLLNGPLLLIPDITLNENWEMESGTPDEALEYILKFLKAEKRDWKQVYELHRDRRDHEATNRIIELLQTLRIAADIEINGLILNREKNMQACREALQRECKEVRNEIESVVSLGLLREKDRTDYIAQIESVEVDVPTLTRFNVGSEKLKNVRISLQELRSEELKAVQRKLDASAIDKNSDEFSRITKVFQDGDLLTANEYIDMVLRGEALPADESKEGDFNDFMARYIDLSNIYGMDSSAVMIRRIIKRIREGKNIGALNNISKVPLVHARRAADMLEIWYEIDNKKAIDKSAAKMLFSYFGFAVEKTEIEKKRYGQLMTIITEPIGDKNLCPVPMYGSEARGRYRVFCVWDRPAEEDLVNFVGETHRVDPTIVLYFGFMTNNRRRELARLCGERRRTFIVVDSTVVLYLCEVKGSRLPVMFKCTLPFTWMEPYTTTAGLVPPELFYGRKLQIESIIDPMGSCIVYGGRQLGKTALLRSVEHTFHNPDAGKIALYIDLKPAGIGSHRPIDELWYILANELRHLSIVKSDTTRRVSPDHVVEEVRKWLNEKDNRRILLLLDEADRFFEQDAGSEGKGSGARDGFYHTDRLKGLMEMTQRRFKVVFAGLHNVQRTTRLENHPLAHFGEPICIGPLLLKEEWREARALVETPLTALGYGFENEDLITRILSQTNYYPSLIQLYCSQLLRHLTNPNISLFDSKKCPPYIIRSGHVEDAYRSLELRKAIRNRFRWTLELDPRYRVIAYSIAFASANAENIGSGFSMSYIRDQVLSWWERGFENDNYPDAFKALLDEMVGLGVLKSTEGGNYSLRSPNVALLIGTHDEIEAELLSFSDREAPSRYNAETFRTAFQSLGTPDYTRRNPLTVQQESELHARENGVVALFGADAGGLADLENFLNLGFDEQNLISIAKGNGHWEFLLDSISHVDDSKNETVLITVPPDLEWNKQKVADIIDKMTDRGTAKPFLRVLFIADPKLSWELVSDGVDIVDWLPSKGVSVLSLRPWQDGALRQCFEDCGFGPSDRENRNLVTSVTGNWPVLLYDFLGRLKSNSDQENWKDILTELDKLIDSPEYACQLIKKFGIIKEEQRKILDTLIILEEAGLEELEVVIEDLPRHLVQQCLQWAEMLNFGIRKKDGLWIVDGLVARILKNSC